MRSIVAVMSVGVLASVAGCGGSDGKKGLPPTTPADTAVPTTAAAAPTTPAPSSAPIQPDTGLSPSIKVGACVFAIPLDTAMPQFVPQTIYQTSCDGPVANLKVVEKHKGYKDCTTGQYVYRKTRTEGNIPGKVVFTLCLRKIGK